MLEMLAIVLLILVAAIVFKILGVILEAGFFVLAVPLKILFGLLGGVIVFIVVPAVLLPLLLVFLLPLLLLGLAVAGLVYLLK
ncbi:MAG: hypothetical protein HUU32_22135 [Calditrichaceae bacterium]|nr:hypothetical protein [Calditrichia bacterium]NUQ44093.1 hypothetical protein [Calditrichaceae bacterium]